MSNTRNYLGQDINTENLTPSASETQKGLIEIANTSEAQGLVDDTRALTPKKMVDALSIVKGMQTFRVNGSFTVPAGVTKIYVSGCGGGGGGAGGDNAAYGGGGGGSGASVLKVPYTVTPGQVIPITIGAGGAFGPLQTSGGNGGATIIGSLVTLDFGRGAPYAVSSTTGGAAGSAPPLGLDGGPGGPGGGGPGGAGGVGAGTPFGTGGTGGFGVGAVGAGFGVGGGGGRHVSSGGRGLNGIVIIEW